MKMVSWEFTIHQLRHTRATYLFETDMFVVVGWVIKEFKTTQRSVNVKDHTLRDETAKVQAKLTNIRGRNSQLGQAKTFRETPNAHTLAIPGDHINTPVYGCGLRLDEVPSLATTCPSLLLDGNCYPFTSKLDELGKQARAGKIGEAGSI